ncbi:MAG: MMPL family transporter, partial [Planctomycetes bacterium]|nr:MMPL family transporter [Planctomycetota bacterium]
RPAGLTASDFDWLDRLAQAIEQQLHLKTLSPAMSFLRHRLVSSNGQTAMLVVNLQSNFISSAAAESVGQCEKLISASPPPAGLTTEITGTAGIGRDYGVATQRALHGTTWVTIVAVLAILILVYRSPVGALVPLVSIGASAYVSLVVLEMLVHAGWPVFSMEKIFAVVLIFGMGVDFALFWIARYREELSLASEALDGRGPEEAGGDARPPSETRRAGMPAPQARRGGQGCPPPPEGGLAPAAVAATRFAGPAIFVSAATTICGLTTMLATNLAPTHNAGKVLALVLTIALLAALTLAPALARLLGRALFWPMGLGGPATLGEGRLWPAVAGVVARRPRPVLIAGVLALGIPAAWSLTLQPRYDSLSELPPGSSSRRGFELVNEQFDKGQLYSNYLFLRFPDTSRSLTELHRLGETLTDRIAGVAGVHDVYSLSAPLGRKKAGVSGQVGSALAWLSQTLEDRPAAASSPFQSFLKQLPLAGGIEEMGEYLRTFYLADEPRVLRFEVLIDSLPFSPEAMGLMDRVRHTVDETLADALSADARPRVFATGPTPYILAIRDVSSRDQIRVKVLASIVIGAIVFVLIRDLPLTLFMLAATWLTYGATIALAQAFFVHVMGENGLDWKVRLIVFVIIVAVGQDYNIFLVSRLFQEPPELPDAEAARRAIVRTGSVISNCGLIMAATLGSLWAGQLGLLKQVGFALALGILLDTFFVRPLLLPSFFLATHRRRTRALNAGE